MELDRSTHWLILSILKKEPFVKQALLKMQKDAIKEIKQKRNAANS